MAKHSENLARGLAEMAAYQRGEIDLKTTRVPVPPLDVKAIRNGLGLSQEAFSRRFDIPLPTLRSWEQGKRSPQGAARLLLQLIERDPQQVAAVVREQRDLARQVINH